MTVFWDVPPCSLVETDLRFRGAYCLHHLITLVMEAVSTSETSILTRLRGTTSQKTAIVILDTVRT
jgi:hypothetical protein